MASMASTPRPAVREPDAAVTQHLVTHRRELHAIPELSFREDETAHYIAERLDSVGVDKMTQGVGGTVVMASADMFTLVIRGKGGHGAQPHLTIDAVMIAAQVVTALQTLVSRETSPVAPVVITLGSMHGGSAANIVAGEVVIQGTLRTFDAELRRHVLARIAQVAEGIAGTMRGSSEFRHDSGTPPTINDPAIAKLVSEAAAGVE